MPTSSCIFIFFFLGESAKKQKLQTDDSESISTLPPQCSTELPQPQAQEPLQPKQPSQPDLTGTFSGSTTLPSEVSNDDSESISTLPTQCSTEVPQPQAEEPLQPKQPSQPDLTGSFSGSTTLPSEVCNDAEKLSDQDLDLIAGMHPELSTSPESESDWHLDPNGLPQRLYDGMKFQVLLLALMSASGRWSDGQMQVVLSFIYEFLSWLVQGGFLKTMVTDLFPGTVYRLRKMLGLSSDKLFTRKAVCNKPDCCALYDLGDIYSLDWLLRKIPKTCTAPIYKNGEVAGYCGNALAQTVYSSTGKRFIMPLKTFCQRSITSQLRQMLSRPDIEPLLGNWRKDQTPDDVRKDVYSGKVWKRMQRIWKFFKSDYEFGLTLNIDWFRPHKASNKSLGAMYMTVLNLPREIRCKLENILLVGVMPSLDYDDRKVTKTEPQNITPFLSGLRNELMVLWNEGKKVPTYVYKAGVEVKAALLLIACDSPAARKVGKSFKTKLKRIIAEQNVQNIPRI